MEGTDEARPVAGEPGVKEARILLVDDQPANILVLEAVLEAADFTDVLSTTDPAEVVMLCAEQQPDLIVLDLHMPEIDGFELLGRLAPWTRGSRRLPVLVATADVTPEAKRRALSLGARDYLTKPLDPTEVVLRIESLLDGELTQRRLREQNQALVRTARDHTRELEDARLEVLQRLSFAAEYRDDDTREHTERIGRTSALLAGELGLPEETVALVRRAAPLHDVGKLAISDAILLKPGRLTTEEFEVMKTHVIIGAEILARSRSPLVQMSEQIALYHHERWDGTGYGSGLRGEEIPLAARIVAVADSFDALTHARPYKDPWPLPQAVAKIQSLAGEHFDPRVAQAFEALDQPALLAPVEPEPLAR